MGSNVSEFQVQCLKAHNEYRSKHKVTPLKLSKELCSYAQEWAEHLASKSVMQHRNQQKYGENIYYFFSTDPNHVVEGKDPVDSWYEEIKQHKFGMEPKTTGTGHFTQVVWKECKELGIGVKKNAKGQVFVVCNYNPPGNYIGNYASNVPPVGGF
ncbi:unnamed protein product [Chironomus riparius]|uniref:SCP domain-containing protein n=1 Tax=Chironomus riparius TaxID=315576 RepID=A0A9N9WT65_9DIPT|nr:unnamed protein product [Chironomus riparius]